MSRDPKIVVVLTLISFGFSQMKKARKQETIVVCECCSSGSEMFSVFGVSKASERNRKDSGRRRAQVAPPSSPNRRAAQPEEEWKDFSVKGERTAPLEILVA